MPCPASTPTTVTISRPVLAPAAAPNLRTAGGRTEEGASGRTEHRTGRRAAEHALLRGLGCDESYPHGGVLLADGLLRHKHLKRLARCRHDRDARSHREARPFVGRALPTQWQGSATQPASMRSPTTRKDMTRIVLPPCFARRRGGHCLPATGARGHIRIQPRRVFAIVPCRGLGLGWGWAEAPGRSPTACGRVWIQIHRSQILVPDLTHHPPSAKPPRMMPMHLMPRRQMWRSCLCENDRYGCASAGVPVCRGGKHEARLDDHEYGQQHAFHCDVSSSPGFSRG